MVVVAFFFARISWIFTMVDFSAATSILTLFTYRMIICTSSSVDIGVLSGRSSSWLSSVSGAGRAGPAPTPHGAFGLPCMCSGMPEHSESLQVPLERELGSREQSSSTQSWQANERGVVGCREVDRKHGR